MQGTCKCACVCRYIAYMPDNPTKIIGKKWHITWWLPVDFCYMQIQQIINPMVTSNKAVRIAFIVFNVKMTNITQTVIPVLLNLVVLTCLFYVLGLQCTTKFWTGYVKVLCIIFSDFSTQGGDKWDLWLQKRTEGRLKLYNKHVSFMLLLKLSAILILKIYH